MRFATVAGRPSPTLDDLLLSASAELGSADAAAARERLDDHARPLFGIAALDPTAQAARLAAVLDDALGLRAAEGAEPDLLLLERALATRRAHPALLACLGAELCRRAGVRTSVARSGERWFVVFGLPRRVVVLDAALRAGCAAPPADVRPCCPHALAFWLLTELTRAFEARGLRRQARRASALRLTLPVDARSRAAVRAELAAQEAEEAALFRRPAP